MIKNRRSNVLPFLISLVLLLLAAMSTESAQAKSKQTLCTAENSTVINIAEAWRYQRNLEGKCVALTGYRLGAVLFKSQRALYRYMATRHPTPKGIVGIPYPLSYHLRKDKTQRLMQGTYIGRYESCRKSQRNFRRTSKKLRSNASDDQIILVHLYGFCASSKGPAIRVESAEEKPSDNLVRLSSDRLRQKLDELIPLQEDHSYSAVLPWLKSIATLDNCGQDENPAHPPPGGPPEGNGTSVSIPSLDPVQIKKIEEWCASRKQEMLIYQISQRSPEMEPGVKLDLVFCLCLSNDCKGNGPVALLDTGWGQKDRPYFCQRARLYPRTSSYGEEDEEPEFSGYSYEFMDRYIVSQTLWQDWGFREAEN